MFENNTDFDFDDNLQFIPRDSVEAPLKRPSPPSPLGVNKRPKTDNFTKFPKNIVKRKFPGPAGILPERKDFVVLESSSEHQTDEVPCSQMSVSVFQNSPWLEMTKEYETLVDNFSIKWIKTRASFNKLPNQKAPFLAAIIQNIECLDEKTPTVNVVLKDTTGEIQGTIIHTLYEEYSSSLVMGAVIVLKQFGVLTTGSNNNHHLTITQNNLVTIYVKKNDSNEVTVVKVQDVSCQDLTKNLVPRKTNTTSEKMPQFRNIFDDGFQIPDNFEESFLEQNRNEEKKKFNFKKNNVTISCSQISLNTNNENTEILQAFEGVDTDSFFDDF